LQQYRTPTTVYIAVVLRTQHAYQSGSVPVPRSILFLPHGSVCIFSSFLSYLVSWVIFYFLCFSLVFSVAYYYPVHCTVFVVCLFLLWAWLFYELVALFAHWVTPSVWLHWLDLLITTKPLLLSSFTGSCIFHNHIVSIIIIKIYIENYHWRTFVLFGLKWSSSIIVH
jgi:hypothetical protein